MDRRSFLSVLLGSPLLFGLSARCSNPGSGNKFAFKYSICSEIFEGWTLDRISKFVKPLGYDGIEIAPFTLAGSVADINSAKRRELRSMMEDNGVVCAGLHWLLVSPKGMHITTADRDVRRESWDYFRRLTDFCADLGGEVMILGSPNQRKPEGCSVEEAVRNLRDGLAGIASYAEERNVTVLLEPMAVDECFVVTSMAEAVSMVKEINSPSIQTMLDFHHCANDEESIDELVRKYNKYIKHVHTNEMDGNLPGSGPTDFSPVFKALKEVDFGDWVSLEVFDFSAGAETIAREAMDYYKRMEITLI